MVSQIILRTVIWQLFSELLLFFFFTSIFVWLTLVSLCIEYLFLCVCSVLEVFWENMLCKVSVVLVLNYYVMTCSDEFGLCLHRIYEIISTCAIWYEFSSVILNEIRISGPWKDIIGLTIRTTCEQVASK